MHEALFPYQREGATWLASRTVGLLSDEMGLGKSAQAINACDLVGAERVMVLCPASARINWLREFEKFSSKRRRFTTIETRATQIESGASVICSYDLAPTILRNIVQPFDSLILDESHYLKSLETKRTKAVFGREGLCRRAKRVWALSGTPAPNQPAELWPLLYTFGATKLTYTQFIERYCDYFETGYGRQIVGAKAANTSELRNILKGISLRRRKNDVMKDLPPILFTDMTVESGEIPPYVNLFPKGEEDEGKARLKREMEMLGAIDANTVDIRMLEALVQSVSTLRRYAGLQKIQPVADLVREELESKAYEKIVIFAIHRDVAFALEKELQAFGVVSIVGGTTMPARQAAIDRFQNDSSVRVFIGNIQAAGTAITLTAAHQVIFAEQDWVPGNNAQAAMRCHRIGQTKPVSVRMVSLADSVDESVARALTRKARDLACVF